MTEMLVTVSTTVSLGSRTTSIEPYSLKRAPRGAPSWTHYLKVRSLTLTSRTWCRLLFLIKAKNMLVPATVLGLAVPGGGSSDQMTDL